MSAAEAIAWWKVIALTWGTMLLFIIALSFIGTEKGQTEGVAVLAWMTGGLTALYLLVLSWRAAYLSGRKRRSAEADRG